MRAKKLVALLFACCFAIPSLPVKAQANRVKIKFEIEGKEVIGQKFKILIYFDNQVIEPELTGNGFIVPPEITQHDEVGVRFIAGQYDLYFGSVNNFDFESAWTIGIDTPPFDLQYVLSPLPAGKESLGIYYLKFMPKDAEGTIIAVQVYK